MPFHPLRKEASWTWTLRLWTWGIVLCCGFSPAAAFLGQTHAHGAEPRIKMILGTEQDLQVSQSQRWYQILTGLKIDDLQIRASKADDKIEVESNNSPTAPVFTVHGRINARGDLIVPGGRFPLRDTAGLSAWMKNLREKGPTPALTGQKTPFNLTREQFIQVHDDLARTVEISTRDLPRGKVLEYLNAKLKNKIRGLEQAAGVKQTPCSEELKDFSLGMSLACLLRPTGLGFAPECDVKGNLSYNVIPLADKGGAAKGAKTSKVESWQVGIFSPLGPAQIAPKLLESVTTEINDVTLREAVVAIEERLEVPVFFDPLALAKKQVNPDEATVSSPEKKTTYGLLLRKLISQHQLKDELRIDENNRPFIWITTTLP